MGTRFLQPGERGFDTASILTRAVLTAAKADGITWIAKYVPYGNDWSKSKFWHDNEIALCDEFDIARVPIYEVNETRYMGGVSIGLIDGTRGRAALNMQGWPESVPMFIAVDTDITLDDPATIIHEGNADVVEPYLAAAFDAQGSARPAAYMDSDGARIMARYNPAVSVPNASWWSQEVYKVRNDPVRRLEVTSAIPGCVMVQFLSGPHYGINIDPCLIVAPLEAWCAASAEPPVVAEVVTQPPIIEEDTMATAILQIPGRNAQFIGQGPLNADGVHCLLITWYGPGPVDANHPFLTDHAAAADTRIQQTSVETLKRDCVLVGCYPQDIQDDGYNWTSADFAHAIDRP